MTKEQAQVVSKIKNNRKLTIDWPEDYLVDISVPRVHRGKSMGPDKWPTSPQILQEEAKREI